MLSSWQTVAAGGNGFSLNQAFLGLYQGPTFATGCAPSVPYLFHPNWAKTAVLILDRIDGVGRSLKRFGFDDAEQPIDGDYPGEPEPRSFEQHCVFLFGAFLAAE